MLSPTPWLVTWLFYILWRKPTINKNIMSLNYFRLVYILDVSHEIFKMLFCHHLHLHTVTCFSCDSFGIKWVRFSKGLVFINDFFPWSHNFLLWKSCNCWIVEHHPNALLAIHPIPKKNPNHFMIKMFITFIYIGYSFNDNKKPIYMQKSDDTRKNIHKNHKMDFKYDHHALSSTFILAASGISSSSSSDSSWYPILFFKVMGLWISLARASTLALIAFF